MMSARIVLKWSIDEDDDDDCKTSDSSPLGGWIIRRGCYCWWWLFVCGRGGWKVRLVMMQRSAGRFSMKWGAKIERQIVSRTQQRVSVSLRKRLDGRKKKGLEGRKSFVLVLKQRSRIEEQTGRERIKIENEEERDSVGPCNYWPSWLGNARPLVWICSSPAPVPSKKSRKSQSTSVSAID